MAFVAALSAHPLAAHAAGEVVGQVLEQLDGRVDVAALVVSGAHSRQFEQIAAVVRATLRPRHMIGATAVGLVGGEHQVADQPAIALWAASGIDATAVRLGVDGSEVVIDGVDHSGFDDGSTFVVLAGPSFPIDQAVALLGRRHPATAVVGGVVAAGSRPSDDKLLCGDDVVVRGAVGLAFGASVPASVVVSRGFRPIGVPLVVTKADGAVIIDLAGRPILDRLDEILLQLDDADASAVGRGLHLGQVADERRASFGPGDFVVRAVTGVDRAARSLTVAQPPQGSIEVGTTVQFLVRDAIGADHDLRAQLAGRHAAGAISFVSAERAAQRDQQPHDDAWLVGSVVDAEANVGAVCSSVVSSTSSPSVDDGPSAAVVLFSSSEAGR